MGTSQRNTRRVDCRAPALIISAILIGGIAAPYASAQVVISQVYGGGNQQGSLYTADYIELFNSGVSSINFGTTNYSIHYRAATGTTWTKITINSGSIPAKGYYLIRTIAAGTTYLQINIPTPDLTAAAPDLAATAGVIALYNAGTTVLTSSAACPPAISSGGGTLQDLIGYGPTATCSEPTASNSTANDAPAPDNRNAVFRRLCGAGDGNNNGSDFFVGVPNPRNSLTTVSNNLTAWAGGSPSVVRAGDATLLMIVPRNCSGGRVLGASASVDLTAIGGSSTQSLVDDGTSGDSVAGDGIYSYLATVNSGTSAGTVNLAATITSGSNSGGCYLSMAVNASSGPANDSCRSPTAIAPSGTPGTPNSYGSTGVTGAGNLTNSREEYNEVNNGFDTGASMNGASIGRRGVWFTVTGTGTTMTASMCSSSPSYDAVLSVMCGTCDGLSAVAGNDDFCGSGGNSQASWCSISGQTYYLWISHWSGGAQTKAFTVKITDNGTTCATAAACTTCTPSTPEGSTIEDETPAGYATNDGCDASTVNPSTAQSFTDVTVGYSALNVNGTSRAIGAGDVTAGTIDNDWYRFQAPSTNTLNVTCQAQFPVQIQLRQLSGTGTCTTNTLVTSATANRCATASFSNSVTSGNWYAVKVFPNLPSANNNNSGFMISATSNSYLLFMQFAATAPSNDTCASASTVACPSVTNGSNIGATAETGLPSSCTGPLGSGAQGFAFQPGVWYKVTPTSNTTITADTLTAPSSSAFDTKLQVFSGSCGSLTCVTANDNIQSSPYRSKVAWQATSGQTYYILVAGYGGAAGNFVLTLASDSTPTNDTCAGAIVISGVSGSVSGTTTGATADNNTSVAALPSCNGPYSFFDVFYKYTPCGSGTLSLDTCGAYDTILSVHTVCPTLTASNQLSPTASTCNDDGTAGCPPGSSLSAVPVSAGTTYYIRVVGSTGSSAGGTYTLNWSLAETDSPNITSCGSNQTASADANCQAAVPNFTASVTASDNCTATGSLVITQAPTAGTLVGIGATTIILTVTDLAGNAATCTRTFTVNDTTPPTISACASNQNASANASCLGAIPDLTTQVTASDNCTAPNNLVITQSPAAGTLVGLGPTSVTLTVKDVANNSTTCNTTVTVQDTTAPTITSCGTNQTASANGNCQAAVPDFTANVTATDNCTAAGSLSITQSPVAGTLVGSGLTTITLTVGDLAGNESTCTRNFTVNDNTLPTISACAANQLIIADASCQAAIPDLTAQVSVSDNCTAVGSLIITQSPVAGTQVGLGATTVTLTVTDAAGNSASCDTTVTVQDTTTPTVTSCPGPVTLYADANCQAQVPNLVPLVVATDNCTASGNLMITQDPVAGTLLTGLGTTPVTITITDDAGLSDHSCVVSVSVHDNIVGVLQSCAGPQTIAADSGCNATLPDLTSLVMASDNCSYTIAQTPQAGTQLNLGANTIAFTVADPSGQTVAGSPCSTTVTVVDNAPPTITSCGSNQSASANANCQAAVPDFRLNVTATDNCTPANNLSITQSPTVGTLVGAGVTNVTITATDQAGNSANCTRILTVADSLAPTITACAPPQLVSASAGCAGAIPDLTALVTAFDNCTAAGSLVITQSPTAGTLAGLGPTTVTLSIRDAANNLATCNSIVTVQDTTPPTITSCGSNQTASANSNCQSAVPNFSANVVASDNCTPANNLNIAQSPAAGTLVGSGVTTITLTVTDQTGNAANCTRTFTVNDTSAPIVTVCPGPVTLFADASCQAQVPNLVPLVVASDNCTPLPGLSITQNPAAGTVLGFGTTPVTITITDQVGNTNNTCVVNVTVQSDLAAVLQNCAGPQSMSADSNCQAPLPDLTGLLLGSNNCSYTITQSPPIGTLLGLGNNTITFTVTDPGGQPVIGSPCSTTATVVDNSPPVIVQCANSQVLSAGPICQTPLPDLTGQIVATDNCTPAGSLTITQSPAAGTQTGLGITTVILTVKDASNNSATCSASITVQDNSSPLITACAPAQNVSADASCQGAIPDLTAHVSATDNCTATGSLVITQSPAAGTVAALGPTSVTLTVRDAANNASTCATTVTVQDTTPPVITSCGSDASISACRAPVPNYASSVTATDNCTIANGLVISQSPAAGTLVGAGTTTVTVTVMDQAGNTARCSRTFAVNGTIPPVIKTCPGPVTLSGESSCQPQMPDLVPLVVAVDNCAAARELLVTQSPAAGSSLPTFGTTPVTIMVRNAANQSTTCTTTVTVAGSSNCANPCASSGEVAADGIGGSCTEQPSEASNSDPPIDDREYLRLMLSLYYGTPICAPSSVLMIPVMGFGWAGMKLGVRRRRKSRH